MEKNRIGEKVNYDGVTYTVGATVCAEKRSDYDGLVGRVVAIETDGDGDMVTANEAMDIYCDFERPTDPGVIQKLEKRMSGLYGKPMTLADIYLDGIVMAPDELCIVSDLEEREETD